MKPNIYLVLQVASGQAIAANTAYVFAFTLANPSSTQVINVGELTF